MAGIKEAMKRVADHRNKGIVVAMGDLKECTCGDGMGCSDCSKTKYIIIKLIKDGFEDGFITVYDYGSDVEIADNIKISDKVMLVLKDNWSASWVRKEDLAHKDSPRLSDVKTKLHAPSRYRVSELLDEIKYGRPTVSQEMIDKLIAIAVKEEGNKGFH